jgi:integrase
MLSDKASDGQMRASSIDGEVTFGGWLRDWLNLCVVRGLRPTTVDGYRGVIRLYVPEELLARPLPEIRPTDLNALYGRLLVSGRHYGNGGLSPRTVRLLHAILAKALADAVRLELLDRNPARSADPPSRRSSRPRVFPIWSPTELRRFLAVARSDELYAAYHIAGTTGLRRGEVLGLRWADVDLERAELRVVQALTVVGWEVRVGPPKTDRSRRLIALDRESVAVLRAHRRTVEARIGLSDTFDEDALVFTRRNGEPVNPNYFTHHFRRMVTDSGLRRIRFHDLRHSHATHLLQANVHPKIVSERLGHASIGITLDLYTHALPSLQREAAEAVARLFDSR